MKDEQFTQILRAINDVRGDVTQLSRVVNDVKEDLRDFKCEMNKRWDENDKRWIENEKKLDAINKKIYNVDDNAERRHRDTLKNFDAYENSIEIMYQDNRKRILAIEERLKVANA